MASLITGLIKALGSDIYPKLVAFDLDGTTWDGWLNEHEFGKNGWVTEGKKEDNVTLLSKSNDGFLIGDVKNKKYKQAQVWVPYDFIKILQDIRKQTKPNSSDNMNIDVCISSKNTHKDMCVRALWHVEYDDPKRGKGTRVTDIIKYFEAGNEHQPKTEHFDNFERWNQDKGRPTSQKKMLLFDDKAENMDVEQWNGVTFFKIAKPGRGITYDDYKNGLKLYRSFMEWRRYIPASGAESSRVQHIGYVGADMLNAQRYAEGKRRTRTDRAARWGYAMYVADDPRIAAFFSKMGRENTPDDQYIVKLYVRSSQAFDFISKVWYPSKGSWQINNVHSTMEETCQAQEKLDKKVMEKFNVSKPYLSFSKHGKMAGMDWIKEGTRFNEMIVYPQIQDAMFFGEAHKLSDVEGLINSGDANWPHLKWHRNIKPWGIKLCAETKADFDKYGERY
ncbi:acid phosphatase-domain-containing protein [Lasiosphaeria miniovina]|uniref:Acid phosphatase-domain-containing protein n=1 Tax=Lasiosphaeria miniovina TaxID=1954250 RepID=A0AA40B3K4_9PEZI|nr:acid phosphatase-domain-containing protein [Lasiosphaeria miniovina]KAK0727045.1 acid phosphatase-domain-containing protein [Lasiosphaeria miniovina]